MHQIKKYFTYQVMITNDSTEKRIYSHNNIKSHSSKEHPEALFNIMYQYTWGDHPIIAEVNKSRH